VDTSSETKIDRLGRRTGPRRKYPLAEKLRILAETRRHGASVADVARANGVNANVVFGWRRLAQRGHLREPDSGSVPLLPVRLESATVVPGAKSTPVPAAPERQPGILEIELPGGARVRVHGHVDSMVLKNVFAALAR
jgi:transposase